MRKSITLALSIWIVSSAVYAADKDSKDAATKSPSGDFAASSKTGTANPAVAANPATEVAKTSLPGVQEQMAKGDLLADQDKYDDAIAAYRAVLIADPTNSTAHERMAVVWLERGNANYAQAEDETAIKLNPKNSAAYQHLGLSLGILQQYGAAVKAEKAAIALKPDFQDAYEVLGKALSSSGHFDEAVVALKRAIALDPKDIHSYLTLGAVYGRKSSYADAIKMYEMAALINPRSVEAHTGLGQAYGHMGDTKNQIKELKIAVKLAENDPSTHGHLGSALTKSGDIDGALKEGAIANQLRLGQSWTTTLNKFLLGWACVFLLFGLIFGVIFAGSLFKPQAGETVIQSFFLVLYKERPGRFVITNRRFIFIPEAFSRWFGSTRVSIERDLIAKMSMTKTAAGGIVTIETADGSTLPFRMSNLIFNPLSKELEKIGYSENYENQRDTQQINLSEPG
jgi:tetratricopeptide (TPR) repeat protein